MTNLKIQNKNDFLIEKCYWFIIIIIFKRTSNKWQKLQILTVYIVYPSVELLFYLSIDLFFRKRLHSITYKMFVLSKISNESKLNESNKKRIRSLWIYFRWVSLKGLLSHFSLRNWNSRRRDMQLCSSIRNNYNIVW